MNDETINIDEQLDILEETKSQIKQAIINKGQSISESDSFRSYATKIENISTIKAQTKTIVPTTSQQIVTPDQSYNALSSVTVNAVDNTIDSNIVAENIKDGVSILGINGSFEGDYTKTLTPEEYNYAVDISEDILGGEGPQPTEIQTYYEIEYD